MTSSRTKARIDATTAGRETRSALLMTPAEVVWAALPETAAALGIVVEASRAGSLMADAVLDGGDLALSLYPLAARSQIVADLTDPVSVGARAVRAADILCAALTERFNGEIFAGAPARALVDGALQVMADVRLAAAPDAVWALIGDRYRFSAWHPMIQGSLALHEGRHRRDLLQGLADGGTLEKFLYQSRAERRYVYAKVADDGIDAAWSATKARYFFPFSAYLAELAVLPTAGEGAAVRWTGWLRFDAGVDEESRAAAEAQTLRFYRAGLAALEERFGRA